MFRYLRARFYASCGVISLSRALVTLRLRRQITYLAV
jgi:hypothetical protein